MNQNNNIYLLNVNDDTKERVREAVLVVNYKSARKDIENIQEWFKKQEHLPRIELDERIVERILMSRKGSVEQTKNKIDMMFSVRSLLPDLATPRDIDSPAILKSLKGITIVPLPKLNHDLTRINLYKYTTDVANYNFTDAMKFLFMTMDYRLKYDCSLGDRSLIDLQNRSLRHAITETPSAVNNVELLVRKAYGIRLFGLHVINAPSYVASIIGFAKRVLSPKIAARIYVHELLEDLYKVIDKDILPEEYGGKEKSAENLAEDWKLEFRKETIRKYLKDQEKLSSDESKRIGVKFDEELLGVAGTFRTIQFD